MTRRDTEWGLSAHTLLHLERLREAHPGLVVTSGRRTPQHNRDVGGVPSSYHLRGRAIDIAGSPRFRQAVAATAWSQRVSRRCTGPEEVIDEGDHLHIAW